MEFGVHLPIVSFPEQQFSLKELVDYAETAEQLGFTTLCANDHLIAQRPWIDSLTTLASVLAHTHRIALMTTAALPVIRGPVQLAKALAALDILSGGRLIVGVSPGSSQRDYALVGVAFEERWKRFEESVRLLRYLLYPDTPPFSSQFYASGMSRLEPLPARAPGLPIWVGSWGSDAGLRRVARLGDGWLASAYNMTPASFVDKLDRLRGFLRQAGKEPGDFPHAVGTMFFHLTEDRSKAEELLADFLSPFLGHPVELLRDRMLIGATNECVEKLTTLRSAGVRKLFLWPLTDNIAQIVQFHERVLPRLPS